MISDDELDEIQARADAATPGPWRARACGEIISGRHVVATSDGGGGSVWVEWRNEEDKRFAAHARTDVPRLIAEIRRAKAECWDEGYIAGHEDARAVQPTYPQPTLNPYTDTRHGPMRSTRRPTMSSRDRYPTPERRAELRKQAESARPFVRHGGVDPAGTLVIAADLLDMLDAVDERDRLAAAIERVRELHGGNRVCGNPRHTNPEVDCPDCGVVCESCGDLHPCPTLNIVAEADHE